MFHSQELGHVAAPKPATPVIRTFIGALRPRPLATRVSSPMKFPIDPRLASSIEKRNWRSSRPL
jgi:hypothetical protein